MTGCDLLDFGKPARQNGKRLPCERLMAENAKLRELVSELYEDQCDGCDRWKYRDRMRELGVEV